MQEFYSHPRIFRQWLKDQWGLDTERIVENIQIEGSPERTLSRIVIQDAGGERFLLEKYASGKFAVRERVARALEYVYDNGLEQAVPYFRSRGEGLAPVFGEAFFQLSRFHATTPLMRPHYLQSAAMGDSFARFLIELNHAARGMETHIRFPVFSIKTYVYQIFADMRQYDPQVYDHFVPVLDFLEQKFMKIHDLLPLQFCHGDLHPLNVIWDRDQIKAVIDWEFAGVKPDVFDAANLVGCAGIEDPRGLARPMVMTFVRQMKQHSRISRMGWRYFLEYLIALRFAWLSEWLRKKDTQMIEMEEVYMKLLVANRDVIVKGWRAA